MWLLYKKGWNSPALKTKACRFSESWRGREVVKERLTEKSSGSRLGEAELRLDPNLKTKGRDWAHGFQPLGVIQRSKFYDGPAVAKTGF